MAIIECLTANAEKTGNVSGFALPCVRANRLITLKKILTINGIDIPSLTIND
ncbi:MAG: hypothetical protein KME55_12890 [Nostoc indistinguendum CM1-VF10]|nr:hypothetical protein [Nostoc indistinguendum CM1-VF10]